MENQQLKMPNITLENTSQVKCKCGNRTFHEALVLRKASAIITGTREMVLPIPLFICAKCGEPCEELLTSEIKRALEE